MGVYKLTLQFDVLCNACGTIKQTHFNLMEVRYPQEVDLQEKYEGWYISYKEQKESICFCPTCYRNYKYMNETLGVK